MKLPSPRAMFLLDGFGGIATALMLCIVLPWVQPHIGLSRSTLVALGLFGVVYGAYSLGCARFVTTRWRGALRVIIGANVLYCGVSAVVVVAHRDVMTAFGVAYFAAEIALIIALVCLELAVLKRGTWPGARHASSVSAAPGPDSP